MAAQRHFALQRSSLRHASVANRARNANFRNIMTGELAPARHVPCAATRCREPGSNPPFDATLVATVTPRPFDLGDRHIRQNQTRRIWEKAYRIAGESQVKACGGRSSSRLGII